MHSSTGTTVLTPSLSLMLRGKYLDHLGQSVNLLTLNLKQMHRGRWEIYYQLSFQSTVTP